MTTVFDLRKYAALLSRALPVVITTEAEYDQTISEIHRLLRKGEANLSLEEVMGLPVITKDWEIGESRLVEVYADVCQHLLG
jgi:hypothetical protein